MRDLDSIIKRDLEIVDKMQHNVYEKIGNALKIVDTASTKTEAEFIADNLRKKCGDTEYVVRISPAAITI